MRRVDSIDELLEKFEHGNWSVRTGFLLGDLAFVEQVSGGNEWLTLCREEQGWRSFESISFCNMIENDGTDYCREYLSNLQPHVPEQQMDLGMNQ
ncbi:hypothetical protein LJC63_00630 [Ruminococcaceae bacterium OttesenSCG-928-L11]|nr:hypothetical protein [Ruminococcaceae bacterium OttesenSCG-928-L11]